MPTLFTNTYSEKYTYRYTEYYRQSYRLVPLDLFTYILSYTEYISVRHNF
jgi:hypothetical protein